MPTDAKKKKNAKKRKWVETEEKETENEIALVRPLVEKFDLAVSSSRDSEKKILLYMQR